MRSRAFTLLEMMLAMVILATALLALSLAASRCVRGYSSAENVQTALNIVEDKIEEWTLANAKREEIKTGIEEGELTVRGRPYAWRNEVTQMDDPKMLKYQFTVSWKEGGSAMSRTFNGIVPRMVETQKTGATKSP